MDNSRESSIFNDAQKILLIIPDWPLNNIIHQLKRYETDSHRVQKVLLRKLKKIHKDHHHSNSMPNSKRVKLNPDIVITESEISSNSDCEIIGDKNKINFENDNVQSSIDLNENKHTSVVKKRGSDETFENGLFEFQGSDYLINKPVVENVFVPYENLDFIYENLASYQTNFKSNVEKQNNEVNLPICVDRTVPKIASSTSEYFTNNTYLNTPILNTLENIPSISTCNNESNVNNITYFNNDLTVVKETNMAKSNSSDSSLNVEKHEKTEYLNFPSTSSSLQNIYSIVTETSDFSVKNTFKDYVQLESKKKNEENNLGCLIKKKFKEWKENCSNFTNNQNMNIQETLNATLNQQSNGIEVDDPIITMISGMFPAVSHSYIKKLKTDAISSLPNEHAVCDYIVDILLKENEKKCIKNSPNTSAANISNNMTVEVIDIDTNTSDSMDYSFSQSSFFESNEFNACLDVLENENKFEKTATSDKFVIETGDKNINENTSNSNLLPLVATLLKLFPLAEPQYLKNICLNKNNSHENVNNLISFLLERDYPKRTIEFVDDAEIDEEEQYNMVLEMLPDIDPSYLRLKCSEFYREPEVLKKFINELLETRRYPTLKDFQRRQKLSAQQKQYTTEFSVEKYLDVIPNPHKYFDDPNRSPPQLSAFDKLYLTEYFKNHFNNIRVVDVIRILKKYYYNPTVVYNNLLMNKSYMRTKRKLKPLPDYTEDNILLLQELAYLEHQEQIKEFITQKAVEKEKKRKIAKLLDQMKTCECCYSEEIMQEDSKTCSEGHIFCTECIVRSIEIAMGENKTNFSCLAECKTEFSLQTLKDLLKPNIFSKLAQRKMLEEIKAAGIEELESCPFCDFATIPAPGDKVFRCLNNDCMRESCRLCHEPSHIPYRCDEIEKPDEIKARIYIEDKMTEALLRKCWKCGAKFIKETGCNKMTCSCGAKMCYVCSQPVKNYDHFNGQGGLRMDLCPLYSDADKLHLENVKSMAETAKQEIKNNNPNIELKFDPSKDLPEAPKEDKIYKPGNLYVVEEHIRELQNNDGIQFAHQINNRRPYNNHRNDRNERRNRNIFFF